MKPVRDFLKRFDQMANSRSKEMRLSFDEARALASAIGQLMSKKLDEREDIDTEVVISGGSLSPK